MKLHKAAFVVIMAAAALSQGCATVATHYQVRGAMEREARANVMRGRGALCTVDGQSQNIDAVKFWDLIVANWPDYLKAIGLDAATVLAAWYIYEQRDNGGGGDTIINHNYPEAPATEAAAQ